MNKTLLIFLGIAVGIVVFLWATGNYCVGDEQHPVYWQFPHCFV